MRQIFSYLTCCVILLIAPTLICAQQNISPEKSDLIKELLDLTDAKAGAVLSFNAVVDQQLKTLPDLVWSTVSGSQELKSLTPQQQEKVKKVVTSNSQRILEHVRKVFLERIDFGKITDEVYYPLFDKYFTEDELKEINAFYRTPIGNKTIKMFPKIFGEAVAKANDLISPKVSAIVNEVLEPEMSQLQKEIDAAMKPETPTKTAAKPSKSRSRTAKP
jgi:uncharacterized protein